MTKKIRIGSHAACWGDWPKATPQLLNGGKLDYLVGDYLAEVTMAILAKAKSRNPGMGYATDFVSVVMQKHMRSIKAQGIKVVVNAGGIAPGKCRDQLLAIAKKQGVDLKVGVVLGDDLMARTEEFRHRKVGEMFSGEAFPSKAATMSCNAYLGAFPIAEALRQGCDVVITGRVVDSALVLAPLIHEFGWTFEQYDQLAAGTLAGHLIECGAHSTGGLFTDYENVLEYKNIGYPIVEVEASGEFTLSKTAGTDGLVCFGGVCEQMLYEVQDPGAYHVPDVACDFTQVQITEVAKDIVRVTHCKGQPPTDTYKVSTTHANGWKWTASGFIIGHDAAFKARRTGHTLVARFKDLLQEHGLPAFLETRVEALGGGEYFRGDEYTDKCREVMWRVALRHTDRKAFKLLNREIAAATVSFTQGHAALNMPAVTEVVSSYMHLEPKQGITAVVDVDGKRSGVPVPTTGGFVSSASQRVVPVPARAVGSYAERTVKVPLLDLCYARSGDKGDKANIGLIARRAEYLPLLRQAVTADVVKKHFAHKCRGEVIRYDVVGTHAMNFLLDRTLGGGGTTSLHSDPLAKCFGQVLLGLEIDVPVSWWPHLRQRLSARSRL